VVVGFVARLPMSMLSLGMVLLVQHATGSYALAGGVTAASQVAGALLGPAIGRQMDRRGQSRVLPVLITVHGAGLVMLIVLAQLRAPTWTLFASAIVTGLAYPAIGFLVRARWSAALGGTPELQTAFALESILDEVAFVLGPPLVTVLATGLHPTAGLAVALTITVIGGAIFTRLRASEPEPSRVTGRGEGSVVRHRGVLVVVLCIFALAMVFGAVDVATVAFADEHGTRASAGFALATFSAGSMVAGLVAGVRRWRLTLAERLWRGCAALAVALVSLPLVDSVGVLSIAAFIAGLTIAPTLIAGFSLAEHLVPATQLSEAFAVLGTAVSVGLALGSAVSGQLVDSVGASAAYLLAPISALIAALIAGAGRRQLTLDSDMPAPGAGLPAPAAAR
jgi:MFS family permease